jgi:hypothetical protein|tara:strand:+ start:194 stop:481 length:288 start_codon:yes stop_codon:yes gene_type:complete
MEDLFKNTLQDLEKTYSELGQMKNQLLSMSLDSFNHLFEGEDPIYKKMDQKSSNEAISSLKKDLLPLFEEQKFKDGVVKVKKYIKLLQENLEKQK